MTDLNLSPELQEKTARNYPTDWTDLDTQAVDTARVLAADAVQNCGSGHPGTAMSLAPLAYTLYQRTMTLTPRMTSGSAATGSSFLVATLPSPSTSSFTSRASALKWKI